MTFPESELTLNAKGEVYHLGLLPENISNQIILVGDQDRVEKISSYFESIEFKQQHREFVTHTGYYKGKRLSVISTGIGTDNIDIVLNELDALVNIDLKTRTEKPTKTVLEMIRIGTCGILQGDIAIHSYILSKYSVGLDNIAHFYDIPFTDFEKENVLKIAKAMALPTAIAPYMIASDENLNAKLMGPNVHAGITVTSSGFYGPQSRQLTLKTHSVGLADRLTDFEGIPEKVNNFEMETSAIFALSRGMGHQASAICLGLANRVTKEFSKDYTQPMEELIQYVLDRI